MSRCPNLIFEAPDTLIADRSQGKFYCAKSDQRLSSDTLSHLCSCSYEDKFKRCEIYIENKNK